MRPNLSSASPVKGGAPSAGSKGECPLCHLHFICHHEQFFRLAQTNSLEAQAVSLTSPVCLEGKARWSELTTVAGAPVQTAPNDRWFANVALSATQPTEINASLENGALLATRQITWLPANLLATGDLTIRQGDSLKLTAFTGTVGTADESVTLTVNGQTTTLTADQFLMNTFSTPGSFPVHITHTQKAHGNGNGYINNNGQGHGYGHVHQGNVTTATVTINVVAAPALESPVCVMGSYREVDVPALPTGVSLQLDQRLESNGTTTYPAGSQRHILRLNTLDDRTGVFRLGGNTGPVMAALPFRAMRVRNGSKTGVIAQTMLGDNTWDVVMPVIVDGLYDGVTVHYDIIIGGVTFDDGSLSKTLAVPMDFSPQGDSLLHFLKTGLTGSNCYRASIWQGLTRIF